MAPALRSGGLVSRRSSASERSREVTPATPLPRRWFGPDASRRRAGCRGTGRAGGRGIDQVAFLPHFGHSAGGGPRVELPPAAPPRHAAVLVAADQAGGGHDRGPEHLAEPEAERMYGAGRLREAELARRPHCRRSSGTLQDFAQVGVEQLLEPDRVREPEWDVEQLVANGRGPRC